MRTAFLCLALVGACCSLLAADAVQEGRYFDETASRHLTLEKAGSGASRIIIRFAADPGSEARWTGIGQRDDKQLVFALEVEDNQDRGAFYIANISESKVDITLKPGQKKAQDAGIVGTYRHTSGQKLQQVAKKEAQLANTRLLTALKNGVKKWSSSDRPALSLWKDQWPGLRDRWMDISYKAPAKDPKAKDATPANPAEKPAEYWFKLAEATMHGYSFVETLPDPKTGTGWEAEYDDFAGGHVSITQMRDGGLHVTLSISRAGDTQTGTIDTLVKAADVSKDKTGSLAANFTVTDPEVKDAAEQAKVHLTKIGHYLKVEVENPKHYTVRGWFDGIYRGSPPPKE